MHDIQDPYRAPAVDVASDALAPGRLRLETASRGRRFGTFVVDYFGQTFLAMVVALPLVIAIPALGDAIENMSKGMEILVGLAGMIVYYIAFEGLLGRTPGKFLFGTRVVDEQGLPPSLGQVVGRTFARMVPFEALSVLFSPDDNVRGWHDTWPRTRVVRVR